jgi:hypothetical protein
MKGKTFWKKPMFMEYFMVAAWNIWKIRNNLQFRGITPDLRDWISSFKEDFNLLIHRTKQELHPFITSVISSL